MFEFDADKIALKGKKIYETAVGLLRQHGMLVQDEFCRERILQHDGTRIEGERICYSGELIRKLVPFDGKNQEQLCDTDGMSFHFRGNCEDEAGYRFRAGGFAMAVYDAGLKKTRPSTMKDLEEALMLCDVMGFGGHYPCTATDCNPELRNVASHYMNFSKSRFNCTHVCIGTEQAEFIYRLHEVMGPEARMPITMTIVTPFRIEETNLKVIRYFMEKEVPSESIRIVPVAYGLGGMNYPITLGGSWALSIAEHMGLKTTATLLDSGFKIEPGIGPAGIGPIDFNNMCLALGNPNQFFYHFANNILAHAVFGRDWREYPVIPQELWTGSPVPDSQAAAQKLAAAIFGHLHGCKRFSTLGNLCVDDVFSCEQMLLDTEMIKYAGQVVTQFGKADDFMDLASLEQEVNDFVINGTNFMMADSTLRHLRNLCPEPGIFVHKKLPAISNTGSDRLLKKLTARKEKLLKQYDFALPESQQRELDKIFAEAQKKLTE